MDGLLLRSPRCTVGRSKPRWACPGRLVARWLRAGASRAWPDGRRGGHVARQDPQEIGYSSATPLGSGSGASSAESCGETSWPRTDGNRQRHVAKGNRTVPATLASHGGYEFIVQTVSQVPVVSEQFEHTCFASLRKPVARQLKRYRDPFCELGTNLLILFLPYNSPKMGVVEPAISASWFIETSRSRIRNGTSSTNGVSERFAYIELPPVCACGCRT